jgi:hypothetical protein
MNARLLVFLLLFPPGVPYPTPSANPHYFRYKRAVQNTPQTQLQTCASLPPDVFAHSAPQLTDLRLYRADMETPYVVRLAASIAQSQSAIQPLNLGQRDGKAVFDAAMPEGHYSDVELAIHAEDFIATVDVTGSQAQSGTPETHLGSYTIFDFTRQKLGRSTVLHFPESDFRYLHFHISPPLKPEQVTGLTVDRIPESKAQYVTVTDTSKIEQKNHTTQIEFTVPANVPVDRIAFLPGVAAGNFSREVTVTIAPAAAPVAEETPESVTLTGNLLRIHGEHDGHRIDEERLTIETGQYAARDQATQWTVSIDNGDDAPIALSAVHPEMLERTLCFDAAPNNKYQLDYGDPALAAPRYDYATLFTPEKDAAQATLAAEENNPLWQPRPDERPFTEKHPALLWAALIAVIALLGGIVLRSAKKQGIGNRE